MYREFLIISYYYNRSCSTGFCVGATSTYCRVYDHTGNIGDLLTEGMMRVAIELIK